jgi:hypothetical protein
MRWTIHRHFKGNLYIELGAGLHSETKEPLILYRCLYHNDLGSTWLRPAPSFNGTTPDGTQRFQPIGTLHEVHPSVIPSLPAALLPAHQPLPHGNTFTFHLPGGVAVSSIVAFSESPNRTRIVDLRTLPDRRRQGHATTLLRATMGLILHHTGPDAPQHRFVISSTAEQSPFTACGFQRSQYHADRESIGI